MFHGRRGGYAAAVGAIAFFLVMSLMVPNASKHGWDIGSMFLAMIIASLVAVAIPFGGWLLVSRFKQQGISIKEVGSFLAGGIDPSAIMDVEPEAYERGLVPVHDQRLARYQSYDVYDPSPDEIGDLDDETFFDDEEGDFYEEVMEGDEEEIPHAPYTRGYRAPVTPWQEDEDRGGQIRAMSNPDLLDLAPTLQVHPDVFLSKRVLIAGKPGSGKTNSVRRLLEESGGRLGFPFLLIDTDGEYHTLLPLLPGRIIVGASNRLGVDAQYYRTITLEKARAFGRWLLPERRQVIFDVKSYMGKDGEPDENTAALVFMEIVKGMRSWQEEREIDQRLPSAVILEEAQVWLPQQFSGSTLEVSTLRALRSLFSRTARDGRRRGVGMVIVAHRIAGILKEILQCDWMILHEPQRTDLKRYRQELAPDVPVERFLRLAKGKAVVISPVGTQEVTFHPARSRDQGKSPGLAELRRSESGTREQQELPPLPLSRMALPSAPETPEVQEQEDATDGERGGREPLTPRQEQALTLWNKGKEYQSVRKLAQAMSIHPSTAKDIIDKLDKYGYIRKNRRTAE